MQAESSGSTCHDDDFAFEGEDVGEISEFCLVSRHFVWFDYVIEANKFELKKYVCLTRDGSL